MGYKQYPALIVIVIVVALLLSTPLAYGVPVVDNAIISGKICCTSNGNCAPRSVGVRSVTVNLNCMTHSGELETLGQGITNATGEFIIQVNGSVGPIFPGDVPPCNVFVNLPLNFTVCPILSTTTGIISGVLTPVRIIIDAVAGLIAVFKVVSFSLTVDDPQSAPPSTTSTAPLPVLPFS
ncbi:uncharacterized protein LOC121754938 [Salvia splendens]|uniref:uncharacterized protein LOC121754938 n=1 Tax=Salvia splendens TaxID=180675 RepID=UPI001C27EE71|nr:uncharacterized protein LOC121754938 [Salvia splendens]